MRSVFLVKLLTIGILLATHASFILAQEKNHGIEFSGVFAPSEGMIKEPEKPFRSEICLNGLWEFQGINTPGSWVNGKGIAPELSQPDESNWDKVKIRIPSPWNVNSFVRGDGPDHYDFPGYPAEWEKYRMAWMKKKVEIPSGWDGKKIILHFEAVAGFTEVYVNKKKVCENYDLFLPFEADITSNVKPGETAEILVGVRKMELFNDNSTMGRRIIPGGSMWGSHIGGIWQDVYLFAVPRVNVKDVFIKSCVSKGELVLEMVLENKLAKDAKLSINASVRKWINKAGKSVLSAPVPAWDLGDEILGFSSKIKIKGGSDSAVVISIPVKNELSLWSPDSPELYGLILSVSEGKKQIDSKYERFGWREWTFRGNKQLLNGKEIELHGDSWHFMGIPQMTRRYAWAWFTALKDAHGNAVRPHAQVYPRFYLDLADEMGVCILDETAIWASDGGPKFDSPLFWKYCEEHVKGLVLRDRNHPSVFGWSVSNENKPVIINVMHRPDLMDLQKKAWVSWRDICMKYDPTRPWISSDGEEDGEGILPVVVGHYGDAGTLKQWAGYGKPWGVGEHGMAYYGSAQQVSKYNGERSYESFEGRMEGLAFEAYDLISQQRKNGASYTSVFNLAWYALEPLPLGLKDITRSPDLSSGIFFTAPYQEGKPGVQPERLGPYCTTLNPGYDPSLPLYKPWPMFDAIKAANAPGGPEPCKWDRMPDLAKKEAISPFAAQGKVIFIGDENSSFKWLCVAEGVRFTEEKTINSGVTAIVDGSKSLSRQNMNILRRLTEAGSKIFIWEAGENTLQEIGTLLKVPLTLLPRKASSLIVKNPDPVVSGLYNSDFYFSEIQRSPILEYGLSGVEANNGKVILEACVTDWNRWNGHSEPVKTASVLRGEREAKNPGPALVSIPAGNGVIYISTVINLLSTDRGELIFSRILSNLGIPFGKKHFMSGEGLFNNEGFLVSALRSPVFMAASLQAGLQTDYLSGEPVVMPGEKNSGSQPAWSRVAADSGNVIDLVKAFGQDKNHVGYLSFWLYSPRALDDLLVAPDIPVVDMMLRSEGALRIWLNGNILNEGAGTGRQGRGNSSLKAIPLKQGWNHFLIKAVRGEGSVWTFSARLRSTDFRFLDLVKSSLVNPDQK